MPPKRAANRRNAKYSHIKPGQTVTFINGACAKRLDNGQFQFVKRKLCNQAPGAGAGAGSPGAGAGAGSPGAGSPGAGSPGATKKPKVNNKGAVATRKINNVKSKIRQPGKSAGARKPAFLDSSDYVNESSIPTVEELSQNPKAYLHQYKIDSKDAYLEKGSKIVHPRVTVRNRVKIFRYNGNKYTHWSMTEEGIQNLVNKSSPGKTKFKKGDVIKMDTEDEDGQLYIVGKNQKLEEAIGVLAILLGQDDENEEAEKVRKEYPGSYEHLWTHLDAAIARYIDQYL
jgi:hypothetical protein